MTCRASRSRCTSRPRAQDGDLRGRRRRRVHLHLRQGPIAVCRLAAAGRGAGSRTECVRDQSFDRLLEVKISYDRDPARALENTRFWAPLSLTPEQKHGLSDPMEMERAADALPIETVARRWIVASSADQALEALQEYVDLGFTHLVVHGPGHDQRRFIDQFAEDVLPGLRKVAVRGS